MAQAHGIAILTLILGGTGLWLVMGTRQDDSTPTTDEPAAPPAGKTTPADPMRSERTPSAVEPGAASLPASRPQAGDPAATPAEALPRPTVLLSVYAIDGPQKETGFRWRFRCGTDTVRGTSEGKEAGLALPPGATGELAVEADGFQPWLKALVVPALTSEPLRVDVGLQRTASQSGVTLAITDPAGAPVGRLRVEVWLLASEGADPAPGSDPPGNPLWSRTREQQDGNYRLPDLQPGRYALLATPVDADGMPQPLQSFRTVFSFTGSEAIPLVTACPAGTVVRYALAAANGGTRQLRVRTRNGNGEERRVLWRSKTAEGVSLNTDAIKSKGLAAPHEALPPGAWTIEVFDGDTVLATTRLQGAGVVEQTIDLP